MVGTAELTAGDVAAGVDLDAPALTELERNAQTARLALMCWAGLVQGETSRAIAGAVYAPDFRSYGPARSELGVLTPLDYRSPFEPGFSDRRIEIRRVVPSRDRVVSYVRFYGRHTGTFQGHEATGREMAADGYVVHRMLADGRVAEEWTVLRWS